MKGQSTGIRCSAVAVVFEIEGADTQERVERAGGSSRAMMGVGWSAGLADRLLVCLALRGVAGGVSAAVGPAMCSESRLDGVLTVWPGILWGRV